MKKILNIVLIVVFFWSCDDFLEEKSQDLIIPKTVSEYSEFLFGEGYIRDNVNIHTYLDIMTDDVTEKFAAFPFMQMDIRDNGYGYFTWQKTPEYGKTKLSTDDAWNTYYKKILIANNVIEMIDDARGSDIDKKYLKAEAYFLRAYSYFMLVNLYGEPYVKATSDVDLGVPVNLKHTVQDVKFVRESVFTVYKQIQNDLKLSVSLFKEADKSKTVFRASLGAAYFLSARVSLYKKEYKDVIMFVDEALKQNSALYNINLMHDAVDWNDADGVLITKSNPEIIWTYGNYDVPLLNVNAYRGCFPASKPLYNEFSDKDLRKGKYIKDDFGSYIVRKNRMNTGVYGFAFRTSELYLNRAEANAELGNLDLAKNDIKYLRSYRYSEILPITESTQSAVIALVRKEHRLEFCFEQHRWFDLRRWNRPIITHSYTLAGGGVSNFILEKDDKAYTLPIPIGVREFDLNLKNIERPVRKVSK